MEKRNSKTPETDSKSNILPGPGKSKSKDEPDILLCRPPPILLDPPGDLTGKERLLPDVNLYGPLI